MALEAQRMFEGDDDKWKPVWRSGAMVGHFGDSYVAMKGCVVDLGGPIPDGPALVHRYASTESLEGGFPAASLPFHTAVMKRILDNPVELGCLSPEDMAILADVHVIMKDSCQLAQDTLYDKDNPDVRVAWCGVPFPG